MAKANVQSGTKKLSRSEAARERALKQWANPRTRAKMVKAIRASWRSGKRKLSGGAAHKAATKHAAPHT